MAGLRAWFRQVAQAVEEEVAKQRGDDPRSRPGYGAHDAHEEPAPDAEWETQRETARAPPRPWKAQTTREPLEPQRAGTSRASEHDATCARAARCADVTGHSPWDGNGSRGSLPYAHASPSDAVMARIRARLVTPDALREAFVIKEILDRPLARRRAR